ncbi:MAG: alpha/beta fold hydrolase [Flavipsychrobacter sp.]
MLYNPLKKNNVTVLNGDTGKRTIVFAHGFGTNQTAWQKVALAFSDDYRLILYDNVGAGNSEPAAFSPNKYDSLHSYADDLLDICTELQIKDAIMVGHSVSGMISLLAAIKNPTNFSKMVLIGASPRYLDDVGYIGGFTQQALDDLYDAMANNYYAWVSGFAPAAMANADRPQLAASFAQSLSAIRPDIAQSVARVIFQSDHRNDLPKLQIDTLLLQTQQDIAVPMEVAEYLNTHIKNSKLKVVNAEGHFPHMSAPDEIITAIKEFI